MKVLVTGGAGFTGSHIVEHFQAAAEVRVSGGRMENEIRRPKPIYQSAKM